MHDRIHYLESQLQITFKKKSLLKNALTHPSANCKNKNFERFEFLGDRVLDLIIAEELLKRFPLEPEGSLAKRQAVLVSKEACQAVAKAIKLENYIDVICENDERQISLLSILADTIEAILGAIFLDQGFETCKKCVLTLWEPLFHNTPLPPKDPKSTLQEWTQKEKKIMPTYRIITCDGPSHAPHFEVEVEIGKDLPAFKGNGQNRRLAERQAAQNALNFIEKELSK